MTGLRLGTVLGFLAATGCGGVPSSTTKGGTPATLDASPGDTGSTDATTTSDTGTPIPTAAYYSFGVGFELAYGDWVPDSGTLAVGLWTEDQQLICVHAVPILDAVQEDPPEVGVEPTPLLGWWRLSLDAGVPDASCEEWPARILWLGVGPYDARLDPAMNASEMLGFDVFGLYVREVQTGPIYVVGVAGTDEMLAGTPGLTDYGLVDGSYQGQSLLLLSL